MVITYRPLYTITVGPHYVFIWSNPDGRGILEFLQCLKNDLNCKFYDYIQRLLTLSLQWLHDGPDVVSNHQPHDCLLNRIFRRGSKKTSKLAVTGLCAGNLPVTGAFPAQMTSRAEIFPFDDVILYQYDIGHQLSSFYVEYKAKTPAATHRLCFVPT